MFQDLTIGILTILIGAMIVLHERSKSTIISGKDFTLMGGTYNCIRK